MSRDRPIVFVGAPSAGGSLTDGIRTTAAAASSEPADVERSSVVEPAFLCDHMLVRLGRWLRAAGYDTAIADGATADRILLLQAERENRLIVSRDRALLEHRRAAGRVLLLSANGPADWAEELGRALDLDWLHRPFSRCLLCNAPLAAAPPERRQELPEPLRREDQEMRMCRSCGRVYWAGSHVRRMTARLAAWNGDRSDRAALPLRTGGD
jgi:uncharacterized protein